MKIIENKKEEENNTIEKNNNLDIFGLKLENTVKINKIVIQLSKENIFFYSIFLICLTVSILFYFLSLQSLDITKIKNENYFFNWIHQICFYLIFSGFFLSITFILILKNLIKDILLKLIFLIFALILFFQNGNSYYDHGLYNFFGLGFSSFYFFCIFHYTIILFNKLKIQKRIILTFFLFMGFSSIVAFLFIKYIFIEYFAFYVIFPKDNYFKSTFPILNWNNSNSSFFNQSDYEYIEEEEFSEIFAQNNTIDDNNDYNDTIDDNNNKTIDDNNNITIDDNNNDTIDDNNNKTIDDNNNKTIDDNNDKTIDDNNNKTIDDNNNKTIDDNNNITIDDNNNITIDDNNNKTIDDNNNKTIDDNNNKTIDDNNNKNIDDNNNKTIDDNNNKTIDDNNNKTNITEKIDFEKINYEKECEKWGYGLGRKRIETKEESKKNNNSCYIKYPNKCYRFAYNGYFDKSKKENISCEKKNLNSKSKLLEFIGKNFENTTKFAYPLTKDYLSYQDITFRNFNFPKKIVKEIYDYNNPPENNKNQPEVTVTFDNKGQGEVNIEIKRDEKLVKEKKQLFNKSKPKYDNVIMIYIDALSREHFFKTLPKTREILEEYYYDNKNKKSKVTSYQFLKYVNFGGWTDVNVVPLMYGTNVLKKGIHISKFYNQNGYITANVGNFCCKSFFPIYGWNNYYTNGFYFDYELTSLFCDPNVNNPNDCFSDRNKKFGFYSNYRNCLYGKDSCEYVFEYGLKFLEIYKEENKFIRLWFNDAHESTQEVIKYLDPSLSNFIKELIDKYITDKTIIFLLSDHGRSMYNFGQTFIAEDGEIERVMGMLFVLMSDKNENLNYYNKTAMIINEQKMVTPYDIYMTMINGLKIDDNNVKSKKGQSLDVEINGMKRNCDFYNDYYVKGVYTNACVCINFE